MKRRHSTCTLAPAALGLCFAFTAGGCLGGQTGTEETGGTGTPTTSEGTKGGCLAQVTKLVPSDPSPLGFAASSVVSAVSGNRSALLRWSEPPAELVFGPEQGLSSMELSVVADAASARFVHWVPGEPRPDLVGCAPDEVQLDAQVSFATAGGAFAESFPAVLHATAGDAARLSLGLPLATLKGAFSVNPVAGGSTNGVTLDAEITAQATSGTLRGQLERTQGNTASVLFFSIACWPADGPACASP